MTDAVVRVESVSKSFRLPHEKQNSIKSLFVNVFRGRRTYEKQNVLKNVSFEICEGDFFGIVGRNGSGKSTLLKLLAGIYTPDKGQIHIRGKLTPFIELGVGFNPELTGRENVFLNGALLGFSRPEIEAMYGEIVEFAELDKFMDQKLKNYSSGMQVRLAFSIAIKAQSDILLLDEVLAVGDAAFQQKCFDYFEELKRRGQTVVFVSHDMGAVRRFCNKAIYIKDGEITHLGTPTDVADVYAIENIRETPKIDDEPRLSSLHALTSRVIESKGNTVKLKVNYKSLDNTKMFLGISITKDGYSIAEISTHPEKPLTGSGFITYLLHTDSFNPGMYQITGISLFRCSNRELLALSRERNEFVIKGGDMTKGGAVKLADTWAYGKD